MDLLSSSSSSSSLFSLILFVAAHSGLMKEHLLFQWNLAEPLGGLIRINFVLCHDSNAPVRIIRCHWRNWIQASRGPMLVLLQSRPTGGNCTQTDKISYVSSRKIQIEYMADAVTPYCENKTWIQIYVNSPIMQSMPYSRQPIIATLCPFSWHQMVCMENPHNNGREASCLTMHRISLGKLPFRQLPM